MPAMEAHPARPTLLTACALHFLHDGFTDLLYALFPIWAREFSLSFAQVGLLRTAYSGALALFQIPAGFLAERWGEPRILVAGTTLTALGFLCLGAAGGFGALLAFLVVGGLGAGTQHPLSSSLVSRAYEEGRRRAALGTYNFSGDLGKTAWPPCVALIAAWAGWRWATRDVGVVALLAAGIIPFILKRLSASVEKKPGAGAASASAGWGIRDLRGFRLLSAIHGIDNGSRSAFMTFLPFLLLGKGAGIDLMGLALGLTFAGGAVGKFVCGVLAERLGIIRTVIVTEAATGLGIFFVLAVPFQAALILLPILGVALNGTSSVLYGTVAELVVPERRSRAYGLFYTIGIGSGAIAPPAYGLVSDWAGVPTTLAVLAGIVLITIPLAVLLRKSIER
jgi:FSR family fosmidomycin resistance protein-like MFS transporter